jgi:hypothetical protein
MIEKIALDGVGMHVTTNVFTDTVVDGFVALKFTSGLFHRPAFVSVHKARAI